MKLIKNLFFCSLFITLLVSSVLADSEAPEWVDFSGNVTVNGNPAPIGTVVQAFDPTGTLCGSFTVDSTGIYGFLHANRDDITTAGIDEGADPGDSIFFKVNGISATPTVMTGGLTWTSNGDNNSVDLAITGQTISFTPVLLPNDTVAAPGWNIVFTVGVRNDGNGMDAYSLTAPDDTAISPGWTTTNPASPSPADVGDTAYIDFTVSIPFFGGSGDTTFSVEYTVFSVIDPTVTYTDTVIVNKSITDIGDNGIAVPDRFNLFQNYPNPFNPTTNISFSLSERTSVKIEIININGQLVDIRNLGVVPAGNHDIEYDASRLTSGVYFYRMTTDNGAISKKMVLLK